MNEPKHPRAIVGLILLALLVTVALGLQEQRSAPLAAYSPASPLQSGPRVLEDWFRSLPVWEIGTRAFWLRPWPWIVVGLLGFGLLAWGLIWGVRRMERD